jgi:hypothetical protein
MYQWLSEADRGVDGKWARFTGATTHPKARQLPFLARLGGFEGGGLRNP